MRNQLISLLASCLVLFGAAVAFANPGTPDSRLKAIEASGGFMVWKAKSDRKSDVDWGIVDAVLEVPAEKAITLLRDYENYRTFLKFFTTTKVQSRTDDHAILRLRAKIAGGTVQLKATAFMREKALKNGDTHFELRYRKGNVNRLDGDWFVTPVGPNRCLIQMRLLVDPDMWMVSDDQLSEYNLVNSRRTLRAIREILEK